MYQKIVLKQVRKASEVEVDLRGTNWKENFLNLSLRKNKNRTGSLNYGHERNWKGTKR